MCGIVGVLEPAARAEALGPLVAAMTAALRHRGPDDEGRWVQPEAGLALGNRRLAVLDPTPAGRQPLVSHDGRVVVCHNGELYDYRALRAELEREGRRVEGDSDTRVLAEACAAWGVAATLPRLRGMFAFAVWEVDARRLTLARDPLGIKPLYWARLGGALAFASELHALRRHPAWDGTLDPSALAAYLRRGYVPRTQSVHRGVHKLAPGWALAADAAGRLELRPFAPLEEAFARARGEPADPALIHPRAATDRLEATLRAAVRRQSVSDVPLGAFLSGGYDSSAVVALLQAETGRRVQTFSVGFAGAARAPGAAATGEGDEAAHARAVAAHLGTEHTELEVTPAEALRVIERLPEVYDEPFADSSQVPTFLLSELARRSVTVALSGDGGDELFWGYNRHALAARLAGPLAAAPRALRRLAGRGLRALSPAAWDALLARLPGPAARARGVTGARLHKLAGALGARDLDALHDALLAHWADPAALLLDGTPAPPAFEGALPSALRHPAERLAWRDLVGYLPDDVLTKVDRASMAVGLEVRVPLLDQEVVELAWRLPPELKLRGSQRKWILRQVLYRHVPARLLDRPKAGFAWPVAAWLRGPLREWAEALLAPSALARAGVLRPEPIRACWAAHLAGRRDEHAALWTALVLQQWLLR